MRLRCVSLLVIIVLTASVAAAQESGGRPGRRETCTLEAGPTHAVVRVVDAHTIEVDDGTQVRLVGALPPMPPAFLPQGAVWGPYREAQAALAALLLGRRVELAFSGRRRDRWGRTLAHAFVVGSGQREWVQGEMLRLGHARAYALPDSRACLEELRAHEQQAIAASAGLWRHPAYRTRSADAPQRLMRLRNTYQLIEGRIRSVSTTRSRLYVNFGDDWRTDFTAGIATQSQAMTAASLAAIKAMEGRRVRVRGWIERRNGPYIELYAPSQIEAIDEPATAAPGLARGGPSGGSDEVPSTGVTPDAIPPPAAAPNAERPEPAAPGALDL